jgi:hypothetical protein
MEPVVRQAQRRAVVAIRGPIESLDSRCSHLGGHRRTACLHAECRQISIYFGHTICVRLAGSRSVGG